LQIVVADEILESTIAFNSAKLKSKISMAKEGEDVLIKQRKSCFNQTKPWMSN
jgi:hypothetical protein